jgi:hypothetical protein
VARLMGLRRHGHMGGSHRGRDSRR